MKKYSFLFLILIVCTKIVYLCFESHYNGYLIDVANDPNVTKDALEGLEQYGHKLSAIGLTLLFTPFFYILFKKYFNQIKTYVFIILSSVVIYNVFYFSLNVLIEELIDRNKDKRYSSYYTTIFKYGALNNKMGYGSFIPNERLKNPTIEDKVLISNMFLLTFLDPELIDRLLNNKDHIVDAYISRYSFDEYKKAEHEFNNKVQDINDLYKEYLEENKKINKNFSKHDNANMINSEYQQFKNDLYLKYGEYVKQSKVYLQNQNPSSARVNDYYSDLSRYFKYQNTQQAKKQYATKMNKEFGYYVQPSKWCEGNVCPSKKSIIQFIQNESKQRWLNSVGNIEPNLNQLDFFKHTETKKKIVNALRKKGLNVSSDFNYSSDAFFKAYRDKLAKEYGNIAQEFQNKFKEKFGKEISMGLGYNEFVSYWKDELVNEYGEKHGDILLSMIKEKNTENFYNDFFISYFQDKYLKDYLLTKEQLDEDEHKSKGDDAIKSLFVIPFAIGMSLFSGLLNFVSLVSLLLTIVLKATKTSEKIGTIILGFVKAALFIVIIYVPYKIGHDNKVLDQYKIIKEIENSPFIEKYSEVLKWILVCEKINYEYIYTKYFKK